MVVPSNLESRTVSIMNQLTPTPRIPVNILGLTVRAIVAAVVMSAANYARVPLSPYVEETFLFLLTPAIVVTFVVLWVRYVERSRIRWGGASGLVGGTAIVAVPMVAGWLVLAAIQGRGPLPTEAEGAESFPLVAIIVWILVRAYLLQGIPEELIFRGWLFDVTRHREALTIAWTTAAFTLNHLTSDVGQQSAVDYVAYLVMPFGMSILGAALVYRFGSFWWAAGAHGGTHLMLAILSLAFPVELGNLSWVVLGLAQAAAGALILWRRKAVRLNGPHAERTGELRQFRESTDHL